MNKKEFYKRLSTIEKNLDRYDTGLKIAIFIPITLLELVPRSLYSYSRISHLNKNMPSDLEEDERQEILERLRFINENKASFLNPLYTLGIWILILAFLIISI